MMTEEIPTKIADVIRSGLERLLAEAGRGGMHLAAPEILQAVQSG